MKCLCLAIVSLAIASATEKKEKRELYNNIDLGTNLNHGNLDYYNTPINFDINLKPNPQNAYEVREPSLELSDRIYSARISVPQVILPLSGPAPLTSGNTNFKPSYRSPFYTKADTGPLFREALPNLNSAHRYYQPPLFTKTIEHYAADRVGPSIIQDGGDLTYGSVLNAQPRVLNEQYGEVKQIVQGAAPTPVTFSSDLGYGHGYAYSKFY